MKTKKVKKRSNYVAVTKIKDIVSYTLKMYKV